MSASGKALPSIRYRIDAQSPVVEIYLLDSTFSVKDRGLGVLEGSTQPGIYKVKFKSGASFVEKFLDLTESSSTAVTMSLEPSELSFATPVPIEGTETSHEYHRDPAERLSITVDKRLGAGSQLFVFVRDQKPHFNDDPAQSLKLLDGKGNVLVSLADIGAGDAAGSRESWHGCNLELDPGTYLLASYLTDGRKLCMPVVTCKGSWAPNGWQTQVFLFRSAPDDTANPQPQLSEAGVLMAQSGAGFKSSGVDHLKWSELARKSLGQGKAFPSPKDPLIRDLISLKFDDPMLGIYAAHCLLMSSDFDRDLLTVMIGNLDRLLGSHPDVDSVKLHLGMDAASVRCETPPMLRSSWSTIVERSFDHPEIIPEDSMAAHAASRTWGEGAWFIWDEESRPAELDRGVVDLLAPLTFTEDAIYQYCLNRVHGDTFRSQIWQKEHPIAPDAQSLKGRLNLSRFSDKEVARSLGLPRSTVQVAFSRLRGKLKDFSA